jgi:hypothetical protein
MGEPGIVDPVGVPDTFATELSRMERVGKAWRFVLTVDQGGEKVVVAKIVMPLEAAHQAFLQYFAKSGRSSV